MEGTHEFTQRLFWGKIVSATPERMSTKYLSSNTQAMITGQVNFWILPILPFEEKSSIHILCDIILPLQVVIRFFINWHVDDAAAEHRRIIYGDVPAGTIVIISQCIYLCFRRVVHETHHNGNCDQVAVEYFQQTLLLHFSNYINIL